MQEYSDSNGKWNVLDCLIDSETSAALRTVNTFASVGRCGTVYDYYAYLIFFNFQALSSFLIIVEKIGMLLMQRVPLCD